MARARGLTVAAWHEPLQFARVDAPELGMLMASTLSIKTNGLEYLVRPLVR